MTLVFVGAGAVGNRTYGVGAIEISSPPHGDYVKSFAMENATDTRRIPLT